MNRRGFALLATLWLVTALSALAAATLLVARDGAAATANRIRLLRAGWAREACAEIFLARYDAQDPERGLDSVDLGRETWCRVRLEDPAARLNLNVADSAALRSLLGDDSSVAALLDWRDADSDPRPLGAESDWYRSRGLAEPRNGALMDVNELLRVRGFDSVRIARLGPFLTVRGSGQVNLNAAPPEVLATLPGIGSEAIAVLLGRRDASAGVDGLDELAARLSSQSRSRVFGAYQELARETITAPAQLIARAEGFAGAAAPSAGVTLTIIPTPQRLAVIRRETE